MYLYLVLILIVVLISYFWFFNKLELFSETEVLPIPFIRLHESFNLKNLVFDYEPVFDDPTSMYLRTVVKANIKSIDINLPKKNDGLDSIRTVEIWNIYNGDNTASSESDFYNMFTEPDFARRANDAKYKLITKVSAGNRIVLNVDEPIKKVFVYARL